MKNRTDSTQLPSASELAEILKKESQRKPPASKKGVHYVDFSSVIKIFREFGLPINLWEREYLVEDLNSEELIEETEGLIDELAKKILSSDASAHRDILDKVFDYLSEEDSLEKADLIFVFGNRTYFRIDKAIELFKDGWAPKIMISGNAPNYASVETSEAQWLKERALEKGVPGESIILEEESLTLADNVKRSLDLIDEMDFHPQSIILVNHGFSQRRGWADFKKFLPDGIKLIRVNSGAAFQYTKEGWFTTEDSIRVIINEFRKMKVGVTLDAS